jgi:hypothetical protein
MTEKAYIVANKEQELEVLKKFEQEGLKWVSGSNPTEFFPGNTHPFPIILCERDWITWDYLDNLKNEEIVYDGRKEEKMYKVTQEFMNELNEWRDENSLENKTGYMYEAVDGDDIQRLPDVVDILWTMPSNSIERNNRLIAILKWLNGEDVFEVEAPHKFVVRNDTPDNRGDYWYVKNSECMTYIVFYISQATKFDTREEAQEWANSHQVVVEVDAEGNEVE